MYWLVPCRAMIDAEAVQWTRMGGLPAHQQHLCAVAESDKFPRRSQSTYCSAIFFFKKMSRLYHDIIDAVFRNVAVYPMIFQIHLIWISYCWYLRNPQPPVTERDGANKAMVNNGMKLPTSTGNYLGGGFNHFWFSSLFGEDSHFDQYFSRGLKPPTSYPMSEPSTVCFIFWQAFLAAYDVPKTEKNNSQALACVPHTHESDMIWIQVWVALSVELLRWRHPRRFIYPPWNQHFRPGQNRPKRPQKERSLP